MQVSMISRPLPHVAHMPRRAVSYLADGLRSAGATVMEDLWVTPPSDIDTACTSGALQLRERWAQQRPDVVHTVGVVATMTAVKAGGRAPIVATFDEMPANGQLELELACVVEGVIPLSRSECERWRRHGVRTLSSGCFAPPMPVSDIDGCARAAGHVVCLSADGSLDALIASMPMWAPARLVIGTRLSPSRLTGVRRIAHELGVLGRIDYRPGLRGADRDVMWCRAVLLVAGVDGSRHGGHVLEAAAHGIPSVAVAQDAHLDHVVPGTTGILVDTTIDAHGLGQAVASVIRDSFGVRAMGTSALVRVRTVNSPELAGTRLMTLYGQAIDAHDVPLPRSPERAAARACIGCLESCGDCAELIPVDVEGRNALAVENLPLARQLAHWYAGRGQSTEDLVQVASLGLVRAAERFDPSHGREFHSFAIPTILGELRRHFRDHAWAVRVPRTLQENSLHVQRASEELSQSLGHDASIADLADELGLVEEEVLQAMRVGGEARASHSLDHPIGEDETLADLVGELDPRLDLVELKRDVRNVLPKLPEREQQVLLMRFYGERTQSEIAERLGISQVHVSRLLSRTLATLRDHVLEDVPLPTSWEQPEPPLIPRPRQAF